MTTNTETLDFEKLLTFLRSVPAIAAGQRGASFGSGVFENGNWWVKFTVQIEHPLAWRTVQELGHVLNYLSLGERLPTVFMPVSPPPYMNGGSEFLSWIVESTAADFTPDQAAQWLEGRLPRPVEDEKQWEIEP